MKERVDLQKREKDATTVGALEWRPPKTRKVRSLRREPGVP